MLRRLREWWVGPPTTQQALIAVCLGAAALCATVAAIVLLDAPGWIVIVIATPVWVGVRLLRYRRYRSS